VAVHGIQPRVAFGAGRFVIAFLAFRDGATTNYARAVTYTPGGGLGPTVDVGESFGNTALGLASGSAGFMVAWNRPMTPPVVHLSSAVSTDGVTWSAPTSVDPNSCDWAELAPAGPGFALTCSEFSSSVLRAWNGVSWGTAQNMGPGCRVAGSATGAAAVCGSSSGTSFSAAVFNLSSWTTSSLGQWSSPNLAIAAGGGGYRVMFADRTATWSGGAWSSSVSAGGAGASELAWDGAEFLGVGLLQDASYVSQVVGYRTTGGVMAALGPIEALDGSPTACTVAGMGPGVMALWAQDELPADQGNRRIFARRW
jgi:hypothetical protein